ncbi:hypothetical protein BDW62DRAFT_192316 [Aspergillus aurantiobrunneus]
MPLTDAEGESGPRGFILHVLCPSLPPPNRFTFNELPLSITVADLKARISQSIPSHPTPNSQRLLYLGKLLSDDNLTLQSLFGPLNGSEASVHLVLPPSTSQNTDSARPTSNPSLNAAAPRDDLLRNHGLHGQQLRYRGPNPLRADEIAQSLHENARRRLIEIQQLRQREALLRTRTSIRSPPQQLPLPPSYMPGPSGTVTPNTAPLAALPSTTLFRNDFQLPEAAQPRLRLLKQYISLAEEQLNCGIPPTIEHVIQLRTHLFSLLDDQLRQPLSERGEYIEPLITRVFDISTRADELRRSQLLPIQTGFSHGPMAPLYLASSPSGYQAVCAPPVAANVVRTVGTARTFGTTSAEGQQANAQPNADAAVMENVVRQAVLNQRPVADGQFGLGRNLRRLWLFMRLYFFCHMFSAPGSQTRMIYMVLAVIVAILSETSVPRQVYDMIFVPVQRHLEGLVHFTPEEQAPLRPQGAEATDEAAANQQAGVQPGREANWSAGLFYNLRRVERSAALFLASLVPGVGERHIEVRNAAEAARNAELARQEEERRRQEEEAANTDEHPPGVDNAAIDPEGSTQAQTGASAPNERQFAIPEEAH